MPRLTLRQSRALKLIRLYIWLHRARIKRRIRMKNKTARLLTRAGYTEQEQQSVCLPAFSLSPIPPIESWDTTDSDSSSLFSSMDSASDTMSSSGNDSGWSDLLGSDWRGSGVSNSESSENSSQLFF